jgi:hypothetical protein
MEQIIVYSVIFFFWMTIGNLLEFIRERVFNLGENATPEIMERINSRFCHFETFQYLLIPEL